MKRSRVLILPGFQLRLVGTFLSMALLAMGLQLLLLGHFLHRAVISAEAGTGELVDAIPKVMLQVGGYSALVLIPLMLGLGVMRTFKIAGPVWRSEQYLLGVASGKAQGPCKLRKGDELEELCDSINAAVGSLGAKDENIAA